MTLDDELRVALNQEADMQVTTGPDVDRLIVGGRARRRRRHLTRAGGSVLAVALVAGGAYGVTQIDRSDAGSTGVAERETVTPEPSGAAAPPVLAVDPGPKDLEPGTYRIMVGTDATGAPIEADLTVEGPGWMSGNFPVLQEDETSGGFGVYRPYALGDGSGCVDGALNADVDGSPQALARQLADLPRSTVVQPVTPTEALGRYALHLRLRIPQNCTHGDAYYRVAETARGSRGITYSDEPPAAVIDFWVLDLDGVPVVVDTWHDEGASADLVDRIAQASESITFVPRT
jgi:hypothetical protein